MKSYVTTFLISFLVGLGIVAFVNSRYTGIDMNNPEAFAYEWQRSTGGIVSTGSNRTRNFKYYHFQQNADKVVVAIVGSSRVLSITEDHFDSKFFYNYASHGNSLACAIQEGLILLRAANHLRTLVIGIDGLAHQESQCPIAVTALMTGGEGLPEPSARRSVTSLLSIANTRLSLNWIMNNFNLDTLLSGEPLAYRCARENRLGLDLAKTYPGLCDGFRPDGSETFYGIMAEVGRADDEYHTGHFVQLAPAVYDSINQLLAAAELANVEAIFLLTPLKPGLEQYLARGEGGVAHRRAKAELTGFIERSGGVVIDASDSKSHGCKSLEFSDNTHALPSCFSKILSGSANFRRRSGA